MTPGHITAILMIAALLLIWWAIRLSKNPTTEKAKEEEEKKEASNKGRKATPEEAKFIDKVLDNYMHTTIICLTSGGMWTGNYRSQVFLSENEVVVQVEILHNKKSLLGNYYFSGKCEMYYEDKEAFFEDFSLSTVSKALQELGFENAGFANL